MAAILRDVLANTDFSSPVAAIKALTETLKNSNAKTMQEAMEKLKRATQEIKGSFTNTISFTAGCDLFMRFVTRTFHDSTDFDACKAQIIEKGELFVHNSYSCRQRCADYGLQFIKDDATILIHGYSRVVMTLLMNAAQANKRFKVYLTESRGSRGGYRALQVLQDEKISVHMILDAAVGYIIEKVDMVLVGAEGVVESGGIINQIGTYQIAVVAKAANKPLYVVAESYKFVRMYPLNQYDLSSTTQSATFKFRPTSPLIPSNESPNFKDIKDSEKNKDLDVEISLPTVDYTPPQFITLLFTDLGVLTSSSVSDELIRLYY